MKTFKCDNCDEIHARIAVQKENAKLKARWERLKDKAMEQRVRRFEENELQEADAWSFSEGYKEFGIFILKKMQELEKEMKK